MKLIVGLGNPGSRYQRTRHNIGFMFIDYFASSLGLDFKAGKGDWQSVEADYLDTHFFLMKPLNYMNRSGFAIKDFMDLYNIPASDIFVIYDDFNLPLGTVRIRQKGSDGGHKGIADIIFNIESLEFPRMRIGIGNEESLTLSPEEYAKFVLTNFSDEEIEKLKVLAPYTKDAILCFLDEGINTAMNKYNRNYFDDSEKDEKQDSPEN